MAEPVPAGSDASAGTYRCTNCSYQLDVASTRRGKATTAEATRRFLPYFTLPLWMAAGLSDWWRRRQTT